MISVIDKINKILEVKTLNNYYREQSFKSYRNIKLEISIKVNIESKRSHFLLELLNKLKEEVYDKGYVIKLNCEGDIYAIKLDPMDLDENVYMFYKLKEIIEFSNKKIEITNIKLGFLKERGMDFNRIHHNLMTYILDEKDYFTKGLKLIYDYRKYLIKQMDCYDVTPTINYLKRSEFEIQNITPDISIIKLKNMMLGLLCEIYENSFPWLERRKIRRLKTSKEDLNSLIEELNSVTSKGNTTFTKQDKVLVYALDRRCPVLLPLSTKLQEELNKEMSKMLV